MRGTPEQRFWAKVDKSGECWVWTAAKYPSGYGAFRVHPKELRAAHRFAWELEHGPIPEGMFVDHACHTRACVRTSHHRLVTNKQNGENRAEVPGVSRGVAWRPDKNAWRARVTHNYKEFFGGYHATEEEAAEAARLLRLELFTHNDADRKSA